MQIELTSLEIAFLEAAAQQPSRLAAAPQVVDGSVVQLLLAMQLVAPRDDMLEITLLGQHLLKLARIRGEIERHADDAVPGLSSA